MMHSLYVECIQLKSKILCASMFILEKSISQLLGLLVICQKVSALRIAYRGSGTPEEAELLSLLLAQGYSQ